jgi:serine/threonine-protein kinase HipA
MAKKTPLGVWLYGIKVAELTSTRPGQVICRYSSEALERWDANIPLLSCSLPLTSRKHNDAGLFFRGMLPEGQALQAMAAMANVATYDTFAMLSRFGRDVAGAAVIATEDPGPRPGLAVPYGDAELAADVSNLEVRPLALYDDSELSLPGLQNKLLLINDRGRWARPAGGRPSTHILKAEGRRFPGLASMEGACLRWAGLLGLTSVESEVKTLSGVDCLIVSRYDRVASDDGSVSRLHQEDSCQALGRDPEAARGRGKYENAGGPSLEEVASVLDRFAKDPLGELLRLVQVVTFTVLIGNADAHGKNLSFIYDGPGVLRLAPLYDTVPTALWPQMPDRAAMSVNGQVSLSKVTCHDVAAEAQRWHISYDDAAEKARSTATALLDALREVGAPARLVDYVGPRSEAFLSASSP